MSTTIVTRLFASIDTAAKAKAALLQQKHPETTIDVIAPGTNAEMQMRAARVSESAAKAYAKAMPKGGALIVVRAEFFPMGAARNAMDIVDQFEALDAGVENENLYIPTETPRKLSIDPTHRHWASYAEGRKRGMVSEAFGWKTVYSGTKFFGTFFGKPLTGAGKYWGTFAGTPTGSGRKFWGTFFGSPILKGHPHMGSFLLPPITKRRD